MSAIATVIADARKVAAILEPALALAQLAQSLTGAGGPGAEIAMRVLAAAVQELEAGAAGVLSADEVTQRIQTRHAAVLADNAAAAAALDARFPAG